MFYRTASSIIFGFLVMLAHGQNAPEADSGEGREGVRGRKAWFMCTAIPNNVDNPVSVLIEDKIHEVTLSIRHMSDPFPVRGDGVVRIVKVVPNPEQEGEVMYQTLAQAVVEDTIEKALIILVPTPEQEKGKPVFACKVLDLNDFRGGDYLYLNLSPRKVMVSLGKERIPLNPGALKIQRNRGVSSPTNTPFSMYYYAEEEERWKMITSTTVVVQPTRREICVFKWDTKHNRIGYQGATFPIELQ